MLSKSFILSWFLSTEILIIDRTSTKGKCLQSSSTMIIARMMKQGDTKNKIIQYLCTARFMTETLIP